MAEDLKIFTLRQVVSSIRKTLEERYQQLYWVKAEMHKLNRYPSGHCFPELLQKEDGKIVAQITGSIWSHNYERINKRFIEVAKEPLKEDTTLLMQVKIAFHETYGLSLQIMDIDPNYALGELQRERQETLKRLQKEGIINANQQLEFPLLPKRIAVISAASSKGLSDFNKVLETNPWGYQFFTMLFPAYLQGDLAAKSIISQLKRIERVRNHFDAVVIVRGGGGEVGLSCYNNYELCAAVAQFPIPILTGIGHSTNMTVAEMIAFRNAITPTELADFLIQSFHNFSLPVKEATQQLIRASRQLLREQNQLLKSTTQQFKSGSSRAVLKHLHTLNVFKSSIGVQAPLLLRRQENELKREEQLLVHRSQHMVDVNRLQLATKSQLIGINVQVMLAKSKSEIDQLSQSVRLLDPIHVLKRGYSITQIQGKSISETNRPKDGDTISTRTANFTITSTVNELKENKDE